MVNVKVITYLVVALVNRIVSVSSVEQSYVRKSLQHQSHQANDFVKKNDRTSSLRGGNGQSKEESEINCVLQLVETQFEDKDEEHHWECMDQSTGRFLDLNVNFDEDYKDSEAGHIESGGTLLHADVAIKSGPNSVLIGGETKLSQIPYENRRRLSKTTGNRSVLVVRVEAKDATTGHTEEDLARDIFGITDSKGQTDSWNLSKAFDQCSYGKLKVGPTEDNRANNGVYTVSINQNVKGKIYTDVKNTILSKLQSELGSLNLNSLYDHVMMCLPQGTVTKSGYRNWYGFGTVNGFVTVLNSNWCSSASLQMHEIGHNLGLMHSYEKGREYEDLSGVMGHSFNVDDGPSMCFNSAKSWQLGWYEDKHTTVNPLQQEYWQGNVVGIAKYNQAPAESSVIVKVEGHNRNYFIGFNHRTGINKQNQEIDAINKITVHSVGTSSKKSELEAKLGVGGTFEIPNFGGGGKSALVQVHNINMIAHPPVASISVHVMKCTSDYDCNDNTLCTIDTCNVSTGMCIHKASPTCPGFMEMVLLTDRYPKETSWKIVDTCNEDNIVMSGGNYNTAFETYRESAILPPSRYTLEVADAFGDGICCRQGEGSFHVTYDNKVVAEGASFSLTSSHTWGSCDFVTDAPTNAPTSCEISYELTVGKSALSSLNPSWEFVFDENPSIELASSNNAGDQWSGSTFTKRGCLQDNCYNFRIENASFYSLKIDDYEVAHVNQFVDEEITLFGTCQPISTN